MVMKATVIGSVMMMLGTVMRTTPAGYIPAGHENGRRHERVSGLRYDTHPQKGDTAMKRVLVGVLAILLVLGLSGCESISEKIGEEVGEEIAGGIVGADVEVDGEDVTIETEDGDVNISGDTGEIPADFPEDMPIYDDSEVDSATSVTSGGTTTYYVNLTMNDDVKTVYEWYKSEVVDEGWTITSDVLMSGDGDSGQISAEKDDMEAIVSMVEGEPNSIGIILTVGAE